MPKFEFGPDNSTRRAFKGVHLRDLARFVGVGPARLARRIRAALKADPSLVPIGHYASDRLYVRPGRRARVHVSIAEAVLAGRVR